MRSNPDHLKVTPLEVIMKYLGIALASIYIIVGALILWNSTAMFNIPGEYALPLGSLLTVYGLFRGYRVYTKYFKS
jgi:hypothetical protein